MGSRMAWLQRGMDDGLWQSLRHTCGYTSLLPLAEDTFLIAHSDFEWRTSRGEPCKAILTRRIPRLYAVTRLPVRGVAPTASQAFGAIFLADLARAFFSLRS